LFSCYKYAPSGPATISLEERLRIAEKVSSDWKVRYKVWSSNDKSSVMFEAEIAIPETQILHLLMKSLRSKSRGRFEFPITFSSNLLQVAILGSLVTIIMEGSYGTPDQIGQRASYIIETISFPIKHDITKDERLTANGLGENAAKHKEIYSTWTDRAFSPDGTYLLTSEVQGGILSIRGSTFVDYGKWLLTVWGHCNKAGYQMLSRIKVPVDVFRGNGSGFAFHPNLPILILSELSCTSAWYFMEQGKHPQALPGDGC